jgi:type III secretion protein V
LSRPIGTTLSPEELNAAFERERVGLQDELGLPFPGIRLWIKSTHANDSYEVLVHDVPTGQGQLRLNKLMVLVPTPEVLAKCEIVPAVGEQPETYWLDTANKPTDQEVQVLTPEQAVAKHAVRVLRDQAHQFVGIQEVQWMLERVVKEYPGLVAEVQKVMPLQRTSEVLKRLLEEHVSIRNMRAIFESLIVWGPKEKDIVMLTEYVRGDLGRYLTHRATGGTGSLSVVLLDPSIEKMIRESIKPTPAGNYLAMAPDNMAAIADRIAEIVGDVPRKGLAVVTSMDIRRYVRRIVEARMRWLEVYSFQELNGQVSLQPVGRVVF